MKPIGFKGVVMNNDTWTALNGAPPIAPRDCRVIYIADIPELGYVPSADNWQHIGYIFPNDPGGQIFPNKLTGGQHAVAAYVKRETPATDAKDEKIAGLERQIRKMEHADKLRDNDYLDRAAFAALTGIMGAYHPAHINVKQAAVSSYEIARAMLAARAAPSTDQE